MKENDYTNKRNILKESTNIKPFYKLIEMNGVFGQNSYDEIFQEHNSYIRNSI